jgi:hypothetical protein
VKFYIINIIAKPYVYYNGKRTANNDLQNIAQKTKNQATRTSLKIGSELGCIRSIRNSSSTCDNLMIRIGL